MTESEPSSPSESSTPPGTPLGTPSSPASDATPDSISETAADVTSSPPSGPTSDPDSSTTSTTPSDTAAAQNTPMDFDLPCIKCRYNLRSLTIDAACPECGSSVASSVSPLRMMFADRAWLNRVQLGIILGLVAFLWTVLFNIGLPFIFEYTHPSNVEATTFYGFALTLTLGLIVASVFLMTLAESGRPDAARPRWAHWASRMAAVMLILTMVILLGLIWGTERYSWYGDTSRYLLLAAMGAVFLNVAGVCCATAFFVRRYAQRMNSKRLGAYSMVFAGLLGLETVLLIGMAILIPILRGLDFDSTFQYVAMVLMLVIVVVGILLFLCLLMLIILNLVMMIRTIKEAARIGPAVRSWSAGK